jgi:hypothetical protein
MIENAAKVCRGVSRAAPGRCSGAARGEAAGRAPNVGRRPAINPPPATKFIKSPGDGPAILFQIAERKDLNIPSTGSSREGFADRPERSGGPLRTHRLCRRAILLRDQDPPLPGSCAAGDNVSRFASRRQADVERWRVDEEREETKK